MNFKSNTSLCEASNRDASELSGFAGDSSTMSKLNVEPNRDGGDLANIVAFEGKASKFSSPLKIVVDSHN